MQKLKTKLRQLKYKLKYDFLTFDNVVLAIAIILCLAWTGGSISSTARNWELAENVMERKRELTLMQLETETLELENDYYKSTEYQELAARKLVNKKLPGENVIYLPENSEEAKNKHLDNSIADVAISLDKRSNLEQWLIFLFGASS